LGNARAAVIQFAARTEFLRLAAGELVYMGLLRTRLDAILPMARIGGRSVPLAPELFSIMADARLAMGQISLERYSYDTADGAGKDRQSALRRLNPLRLCRSGRDRGRRSLDHCRAGLCQAEEDTCGSNIPAGGRARPGEVAARTNRRGGGIPGDGVRGHIGEVWERDIECLPGLCHGSAGGNG